MSTMIVYVTTADVDEARRIGRTAVDVRLAACANVVGGVDSIYRWEGSVQETEEGILILKTTADRLGELMTLVKDMHSYECPCIEAWPITDGHRPFLDWIIEEVARG